MYETGFKGNAELASTIESDRRRMQFLEKAIDLYYIQNKTNITSLMKSYGKALVLNVKIIHLKNQYLLPILFLRSLVKENQSSLILTLDLIWFLPRMKSMIMKPQSVVILAYG